ncbi:MAG: GNAT family N-acetyltransferase [Propionibacteriales bacterium]|nr:GNAT family N-acetyltransferase [Propionibacteriales bacterium]
MTGDDLLASLERYLDAVPRDHARTEEIGGFTLFVAESGWPYYARPRLGECRGATTGEVRAVLARQEELGVPKQIEWVDETTPALLEVVRSMGIKVDVCPLLVLDGVPRGDSGAARLLHPDERSEIVRCRAAISVGFANPGTSTGDPGTDARDASVGQLGSGKVDESVFDRMRQGQLRQAAVYSHDQSAGPVGGGSYSPVGDVAEIAGVGVLPAHRRQGLAAALTYVLALDARARGVSIVFCSAQTKDVARVYERVGFRRVATACIAASGP